ncbi:MAG: hypothetical protein ABR567_02915 [Myxococcales bacterium]|nr:hypothetical protein [Myxococcales bacterium]
MLPGILLYDALYLTFASAIYVSSLAIALRCASFLPWWLAVPVSSLVFLLALIVEVGALTALCPRLAPGRYVLLKDRVYYGWLFRSMLRRILFVPAIKWILFSSNLLRFLALRALGARVSLTSFVSTDVELLDPSLVRIGPLASLGARVMVSCHYVSGGKLLLKPVQIGAGAMLAAEALVAPGVTIGPRASIGSRAALGVQVTVEEEAEIGGAAVVDSFARIGARARIGTAAYVPALEEVAAGSKRDAASSSASMRTSAAPAV